MKLWKTHLAGAVASVMATAAMAYSGEFYVTCRLDPRGDNWLALKSAPDISSQRIAKLGPGTVLRTWDPAPVGKWRKVTVVAYADDEAPVTGPSGWVHTDYICYVDLSR
ncbi:hypothetical protein [Maritimibacter sp. DP1N21-5]|uniref:hypothetical protein n=1 Tax=Maritimibacter sp. DP1N21-5 TaxID=2836867 RepID=UPI001C45AE5C|nr:hypothetical protein [Maritimibacter sp. DP1N21-5]MBV7407541.1 hypothetical protein [Maritimibacter sp. DP1N21-5]